jgi:hypothetical protein
MSLGGFGSVYMRAVLRMQKERKEERLKVQIVRVVESSRSHLHLHITLHGQQHGDTASAEGEEARYVHLGSA